MKMPALVADDGADDVRVMTGSGQVPSTRAGALNQDGYPQPSLTIHKKFSIFLTHSHSEWPKKA